MTAPTTIWRATVLTLFPDMFPGPLGVSLAGKALASGLWALEARDIRDSATDRHRSVDDTPAGGGPGMVLRADVLAAMPHPAPSNEAATRLAAAAKIIEPHVQGRPPSFCTGCPERPIFTAMKLVERELGPRHVSCDIGCHLFSILPPFNIGATTMGYGLGGAGASAGGESGGGSACAAATGRVAPVGPVADEG